MANRYWVGNTGNWSDTTHWSASSGGTGGASVPTSADNVYFDANSFSTAGQTVTVNVTANCLDMDWRGSLNTPTLAGTNNINIYGSLTFISAMVVSHSGVKVMQSTTIGKTINSNGVTIYGNIQTFGVGGEWTLLNNLTLNGTITLTKGSLVTNGYNINCASLTESSALAKKLTLSSSIITTSSDVTFLNTGLTFDAGTSTIKLTGNNTTFAGGGLTYYNVILQGTPITITGNNTFNDLKIKTGNTVTMTTGTAQTITNLHSDTVGNFATMSCSSGVVTIQNASIQDIHATGGASFQAINSTNVSGNSGVGFVVYGVSDITCLSTITIAEKLIFCLYGVGTVLSSIDVMANSKLINLLYGVGSINTAIYTSCTAVKAIGTVANSRVEFFKSNNTVYIMDGTEMYQWTGGGSISIVSGYAPTVFTAAPPTGGGTILESINYINGMKTQKFSANGTATVYQLAELNINAVNSVTVNGVAKTVGTDYSVNLVNGTVTFVTAPTTGVNNVVITWTKTVTGDRQIITKNQYYGGVYYARFWLFGNPDHKNTRYVSGVTMAGVSDPTYWPKYSDSDVGEYEITDIKTQYDKQLIWTNGDSSGASAWYSNAETYADPNTGIVSTMYPVYPMNSKVGNTAKGQVQIIVNNPFSVWKGIYQWISTYVMNEKNAQWISKRIQNDLDGLDLTKAITWDWDDKGLYLVCVGNKIWVLNYRVQTVDNEIGAWYVVEYPHTPTCFITIDKYLYFGTTDGTIMKVDPDLGTFDGQEIESSWEMGYYNFGVEYLTKFIQEMLISILPYTTTHIDIYIATDLNSNFKYVGTAQYSLSSFETWDFSTFAFSVNYSPQPFKKKLRAKKIDYMKIKLVSKGTDGATCLSIVLPTRTGGIVKNRS